MKKISLGFITVFLSCTVFISGVFANGATGGGRRLIAPEPLSCLLFVASGVTYAGMRYLRARRRSKNLDKEIRRINEEGM